MIDAGRIVTVLVRGFETTTHGPDERGVLLTALWPIDSVFPLDEVRRRAHPMTRDLQSPREIQELVAGELCLRLAWIAGSNYDGEGDATFDMADPFQYARFFEEGRWDSVLRALEIGDPGPLLERVDVVLGREAVAAA